MQAADLEKECNSFTVCVAIGMFVLGVWGIILPSFFSGTGLLCRAKSRDSVYKSLFFFFFKENGLPKRGVEPASSRLPAERLTTRPSRFTVQKYTRIRCFYSQLVESWTQDSVKSVTRVRTPSAAQEKLVRVNLSKKCCADSLSVCPTPGGMYTHACEWSHMHVKDPVLHVRVRWITETLKVQTCTLLTGG